MSDHMDWYKVASEIYSLPQIPRELLPLAEGAATLALVEQQRIANLIALAGQRIEYDETTALFTDMGMALRMRQQAFEGLGL